MPIIIDKLNYIYNAKTPFAKDALSDVSLRVEDGDFFGIIGHTGSGKSTLAQHLNGLIALTDGDIAVDGFDFAYMNLSRRKQLHRLLTEAGGLEGLDRAQRKARTDAARGELARRRTEMTYKALRHHVGMVFQYPEYQLFAETVFDDVAFGVRNFTGVQGKGKKQRPGAVTPQQLEQTVRRAVETVGLDYEDIKGRSPFDLSGGQKRRVAIAGVIVTSPRILILDEPTAGLDPQGKKEITALMHRLKATTCNTIVMISHDMNEIAENCTRIALLKEGKLLCVRNPETLFADESLIAEAGMDVPAAAAFARALRTQGIDIGTALTRETLAEKILAAFQKTRGGEGPKGEAHG